RWREPLLRRLRRSVAGVLRQGHAKGGQGREAVPHRNGPAAGRQAPGDVQRPPALLLRRRARPAGRDPLPERRRIRRALARRQAGGTAGSALKRRLWMLRPRNASAAIAAVSSATIAT